MMDEQPIGYWDEHSRLGHEDRLEKPKVFVFFFIMCGRVKICGCNVWILYKH